MKDKMLVISLSNSMGGAEQCLRLIAEQSGCPMLFLFRVTENAIEDIGPGRSIYLSSKSLMHGFFALPAALRNYRNHTIISSHAYLNAVLGTLSRVGYLRGRLIARESTSIFLRYNGLKKNIYGLLYRLGYPGINSIICQSEQMSDQLCAQAPYLKKERIRVVDNPLDFDRALLMGDLSEHRLINPYICAAGRLIAIKGFDILIKAFSKLASDYPELHLVILGEGPERTHLISLIERFGLSKKVSLTGYKKNPYAYFRSAKVCVVSSELEGFPNVLLQMMAVNESVVSTLCAGGIGDIPDIIKVKPASILALEQGLRLAMERGKVKRERMDAYLHQRSPEGFLKKVMQAR